MPADRPSSPASSSPTKRRRGAPTGNTNAVKHGRNSRVRTPALALMQMIQREHPEWVADPRQIPEPIAALFITLGERLVAVEEAVKQRGDKNSFPAIPMTVLRDAADLQARFPELGYDFPPFDVEQQTTNNNSSGRGN